MLLARDDRAELRAGLEPVSETRLGGPVGERRDHVIELVAMHEQAAARVAGLAGVEVDPLERAADRAVHVGVREDDVGRLAAQLEGYPLERAPRLGPDLASHLGRAGEGDLVDSRVVDERRTGLAITGEDIYHAGWEARLERQLAESHRGQRASARLA